MVNTALRNSSRTLIGKDKEYELIVASHTILEIYSVLTSAPFKPKISPAIAKRLINNNIKNIATTIYLTDKDYFALVEKMFNSNLSGGIIYDALIAECALKANADEILTLNPKDFLRLMKAIPIKVSSL